MENCLELKCEKCGASTTVAVAESADETGVVRCTACDSPLATIGELHARIVQEALGLGPTELRDDHVPVDGAFGERPGR